MARESLGTKVRRRTLGIVYLGIVVGLVALSVAFYNKAFTDTVKVTLKTDHTGNSLRASSDVKVRGLIVGSVDSVKVDSGPNGGCANEQVACVTVTLALQPDKVSMIPDNVSAQRCVEIVRTDHRAAPGCLRWSGACFEQYQLPSMPLRRWTPSPNIPGRPHSSQRKSCG